MNKIFTSVLSKLSVIVLISLAVFAKNANSQTITTLPLANNNLCACSQIIVSYSATGVYNAGNIFTAQLSDAAGNFVGAVPIGTLASQALNGNIACTIPCNTPYGTGYRIRIISSAPVAGGPNNGSNITIAPSPTAVINFSTASCVDTLTVVPSGGGAGVVNGDKYYITDLVPWGQPDNVNHMNDVFGVGGWIQASFSTPVAGIYVPGTQFVFIEGSDGNGVGCTNYINANIALIENWVNQGGHLFLNAAPNNGGIQNWGFGGVVCNYQNLIPANINAVPGVLVTNLGHPINLGPWLPVDPNGQYTGNYYAHADIQNGGTTLMHDPTNPNVAVLTEKPWGTGLVVFGGMTTPFYHNNVAPLVNLHAHNIRKNILEYLAGNVPAPPTYTYLWSTGATTPQIIPTVTGIYTVTVTTNLGCTTTATYSYVAPPKPQPNITTTGTLCSGQTMTLDAGAGFTTYLWDNGSTNQTRMVTVGGTYYVTVTNAQGCVGSDTIVVVADTSLKADFSVDVHLGCLNDTVFITNNSTGALNYYWLFGDGGYSTFQNPVPYVYFAQGNYTIRLIVTNPPCEDTMYVNVNTLHPLSSAFAVSDDSVCNGSPVAVSLVPPIQPSWSHTWIWGDGTPNNLTPNPAPHFYSTPGVYTLVHITTDTLGCSDTSSINIFVDYSPYVNFNVTDSSICVGDKISFFDTLSNNIIQFYWDFKDGSILNDIHNPTHTWDNAGTYLVTLTGKTSVCGDLTATKTIEVSSYPNINLGKDTSICPGVTGAILITDVTNPGAIYEWSTGETSNSILVSEAGTYWAKSSGACVTADSITITRDCFLNIPNAFSPDGDGLNDYFIPREILSSGLKTFKMNIYNRWGENIFTTSTIDGRGWDGKYNGVAQPLGTYVYVIDAVFNNGVTKNYTGNVILVR